MSITYVYVNRKDIMEKDYSNIDDIILSFLKDEISVEEKKKLEEWLASDISNKEYFKQTYTVWNSAELLKDQYVSVEKVLRKVKVGLNKPDEIIIRKKSKQFTFSLMKWAAVILVSLCTGALLYYQLDKISSANVQMVSNEIVVPLGSQSSIRLPDGTEVTLNAGSKLNYTMDYGKHLREIEFSGEAYFKVAKQKEKPFIVHTSNASIRALGTEFNVSAYPNENISEMILAEGSVLVKLNSEYTSISTNEVVLQPGQKAVIYSESQKNGTTKIASIRMEKCDPQVETSWKDKRWIIKGVDLERLALSLSRKNNVNIHLKDPELKKYKFSGIIENETVEQVFNLMGYTMPISYIIQKGEVEWTLNGDRVKYYKNAYSNN